jgi:aminoglycoside phosphotransferase family enzyme/gluconate kinase
MERGQRLVQALTRAEAYQHPTAAIRVVETHCAWVLLTGEFAYKIKKPVDFGFLDFSTLEKRKFFCQEEVRLNRRFAADIYLDVVAVTGELAEAKMAASGPVLEYAVRMRQFEDDGLLSQLAERKRLTDSHIDQMIDQVAEFHDAAARASADAPYGNPDRIHHWVTENFQHVRPCLSSSGRIAQLDRIERGVEEERRSVESLLPQRKQHGFIRECHGDLHLVNITLIDGRVTLFDCIEFNAELRWIDVFSDVAFLVMDLEDRGYRHFAFRFLNGYLHRGGDYRGLGVLRYYLVYRALVRAKVAMLRRQQAGRDSETFKLADSEYAQYARLAEHYLAPRQPLLMITCGLSGSGKSTIARQLCEGCGMIQIRSDVERKRMSGLQAADNSRSALGGGLYSPDQTEKTYRRLAELAGAALQAGYPVIVDATFLQRRYRDLFKGLAQQRGVPFTILHCVASDDELERRIRARQMEGSDASEADLAVLASQRSSQEALAADEKPRVVTLDADTLNEADAAWWQNVCSGAANPPGRDV